MSIKKAHSFWATGLVGVSEGLYTYMACNRRRKRVRMLLLVSAPLHCFIRLLALCTNSLLVCSLPIWYCLYQRWNCGSAIVSSLCLYSCCILSTSVYVSTTICVFICFADFIFIKGVRIMPVQ